MSQDPESLRGVVDLLIAGVSSNDRSNIYMDEAKKGRSRNKEDWVNIFPGGVGFALFLPKKHPSQKKELKLS